MVGRRMIVGVGGGGGVAVGGLVGVFSSVGLGRGVAVGSLPLV